MEAREKLKDIVSRNSLEEFLSFVKENKDNLINIIEGLTKKQLDKLWEEVQETFAPTLLSLSPEDVSEEGGMNKDIQRIQNILEGVVLLAKATIGQPEPHLPACLLSTAFVLHGLLLEIPDQAESLRNSIVILLEEWWKKELYARDMLAANTITVLMEKSLQLKGVSGVKRVWSLHGVLEQLDLSNDSSMRICELLKHCAINVNYLCNEEGCRFLGYILTLEEDLMLNLHRTIKNHIPTAPKLCLEKYSEIYFRAWQRASDDMREKLEKSCIQDLMYHAVHAQKSLTPKLRKILGYLHQQKAMRGVDKMLLTLYEPFLWRSLNVANSQVRGNAAALLMDAFPLQNPDNTLEENDELLQKQFNHLHTLLEDPMPSVRSLAVPGHFKILSGYWDMIPMATVKSILTKMIQDLVNDATSNEVREAVIRDDCMINGAYYANELKRLRQEIVRKKRGKLTRGVLLWIQKLEQKRRKCIEGMIILLDNPLSHPMLKPILPVLRNSIHDHAEKVRVAMLDLLLKVQKVRTIKAWDIVPVEHLLVRLGMDKPPVVRRIMKLTLRSFLPLDKSCEVQMERSMAMIQTNPQAARVFFNNVHHHMNVQETATLMINICRTILKLISKSRKSSADNQYTKIQDEVAVEDELSLSNIPVMQGFIEGMHIMWKSIESDLAEKMHADLLQELYHKFALAIPEMLKSFEYPPICTALLLLSGNLPPKSIPTISRSLLSKLRAMPNNTKMEDICPILEALCSWNKVSDLCELIDEWLNSALNTDQFTDNNKCKKGSRKSVKFIDPNSAKPKLAVCVTCCLLQNPVCRASLLLHTEESNQLLTLFQQVMVCIKFTLKDGVGVAMEDSLLAECFLGYCKMLLIQEKSLDMDTLKMLTEVVTWAHNILPYLHFTIDEENICKEETSNKRVHEDSIHDKAHLAKEVLKTIFLTCSSGFLIGIGDIEFAQQVADLCTAYLKADSCLYLLPEIMKCLHQVTAYTVILQLETSTHSLEQRKIIPDCLSQLLLSIATFCKEKQEASVQHLVPLKSVMSDTLSVVYQSTDSFLHQDIMATIVAAVISDLASASSKLDLDTWDGGITSLPTLTSWLCEAAAQKASVFKHFLCEFETCMECGAVADIHRVHAAIHLAGAVAKWKSKTMVGLKEICSIVQLQIDRDDVMKDEEDVNYRETLVIVKEKLKNMQELLNIVH